jgi:uncharacterized RDD family membrane protein YckC
MTDQTAAGKGRGSTAKGRGNAAKGRGNGARVPAQGPAKKASKPAAQGPEGAPQEPSARSVLGGWLEGPNLHDGEAGVYRGERLGLPESGPGALASQGRRLGALVVDWVVALLIVAAIGWHPTSGQGQWGVLAVFAAEHLLLVSTLGFTIGKRLFGLRVGKLGGPLTPLNVIVRTVLLVLVVPAVIWDRDGRGLHDRLAGTVELQREV